VIFWRRGNKEIPREVLDAIEQAAREALTQVGCSNIRSKVKKNKIEALADASGDPDLSGALLVAMATITRALASMGYTVEGSDQILEASKTFLESGSLSGLIIDKIMSKTVNAAVARLEAERGGERFIIGIEAVRFFGKIGYTVSVSKEK